MKKSLALTAILFFMCSSVCFAKEIKQYFNDGKLKSVASYNNHNQLDGVYKNFWPNGRLKEVGQFKNGVLIWVKHYSQDGILLGHRATRPN